MPNWKEQCDEMTRDALQAQALINFISTEIIEKLIEDIPDASGNWDEVQTMQSNEYLKQALRDKWL